MRKFTFTLVALLLSVCGLTAKAYTTDFADFTWGGPLNLEVQCPDGWAYTGTMGSASRPSGASTGILLGNSSASGYFVTKAEAGVVTFKIKSSVLNSTQSNASFEVAKMNGVSSTAFPFMQLKNLNSSTMPEGFAAGDVEVTIELDDECYIGFRGLSVIVDSYANTAAGGGETGGNTMTVSQDFNTVGSGAGNYSLPASSLPEGWYVGGSLVNNQSYGAWNKSMGVDDSAAIGIGSMNSTIKAPAYFVTYVKKGTVSIWVRNKNFYLSNTDGYFGIYKANKDGDTFSLGDAMYGPYTPLKNIPGIEDNKYLEITVDVPEDMYIAFAGNHFFMDNFSNTYEVAAETYTVSGTVTNEEGEPIVGANVAVNGFDPTTTAQDGSYTFTDMPATELNFTVSAEGYTTQTAVVDVTGNTTKDFTLKLDESTLSISISDMSVSGSAITTATLNLYEGDNVILPNVTIDEAEGRYILTVKGKLNPAGYTLKITAPYYEEYNATIKVGSATSYNDIVMKQGELVTAGIYMIAKKLSFKAIVVNEESEYVTDAVVKLSYGETTQDARNLHDGTYVIDQVNAAQVAGQECTVTCTVPNMKPLDPITFTYGADKTSHEVTFMAFAYQPTTLSGIITDATSNEPVEGAHVSFFNGLTPLADAVTTDAEGAYEFTFSGEVPATIAMQVKAAYYEILDKEVTEIEREATNTVSASLDRINYSYTATVVDNQSVAVPNAKVVVNGVECTNDENGDFVTEIWAKDAANGKTLSATASAPYYQDKTLEFSYTDGAESVTAIFVLDDLIYKYTARVEDEFWNALTFATVEVESATGEKMEVVNDLEGNYTFTIAAKDCPEGDFTTTVSAEDFITQVNTFNFEEEAEVYQTFYLAEEDVKIDIEVVDDETGEAILDANVYVDVIIDGETEDTLPLDPQGNGSYTIVVGQYSVRGCEFRVTVSAPEYETAQVTFDLEDGSVTRTVRLTKVTSVDAIFANGGTVANVGGKLYVNGEAQIFSVDGKLVRVVRTQGAEEVTGLQPGLYIVAGQKVMVK